MEILITGSMSVSAKPKILDDNLPGELTADLKYILQWIDCRPMEMWREGFHFRRMGEIRRLASVAENTSLKGWRIAAQIIKSLDHVDDNEIVAFVRRDLLTAADVINVALISRGLKNGKSVAEFRRLLADIDRRYRAFGYDCHRFTDVGAELVIEGRSEPCRFCGSTEAEGATFKKAAHAISYFLGNHYLLGCGECDKCNERFGQGIEQDLHRYYLPTMISAGMVGRGKNPNIAGTNFKQSLNELEYKLDDIESENVENLADRGPVWLIQEDKQTVKKADIYRILCKYAISVLPDSKLASFKVTIDWINGKLSSEWVPYIYRYEKLPVTEIPLMEVLTSDGRNAYGLPYCIVVFRFISNLWIFAVPYTSGCRTDVMDSGLNKFVKQFFPEYKFTKERFFEEFGTYTQTHFTIECGPDSKIKRYCDMTPAEQAEFMARMPSATDGASVLVSRRR